MSNDTTTPPFDENQAVFDGLVRYVMARDGIPENEAIVNLTNLLGSDEVTARHAEKVRNSPAVKLVEAQTLIREAQDVIAKLTALLQAAPSPGV
jgi:hypothetical protein